MNQNLITLDRVAIGYNGRPIVTEISLDIPCGSFTGLLGSNGSGKTTLLKTLIGVLPLVSGWVELSPVNGRRSVVGYVPQRESLDPMFLLSGFEVALMGCYGRAPLGRWLRHAEREWTRECLRQTGAAELEKQRFAQLSGGQKQRVLIARALVTRPDILVLDEPTAGIDTAATQAILELLRQLHHERGLSIIMVNHDLPVVRQLVERVIWLHHGQVLQGPVAELLNPRKIDEILELELS